MNALRRVLRAPGLWLGLFALQLGVAWSLAQPIEAAVRATLDGAVWLDPHRLIVACVELVSAHPAVAAALVVSAIASALIGAALSLALGGGVAQRLAGPCGAPEFARACVAHLPAVAAIAGYGLLLRLLLSFAAHALVGTHVLAELVVLLALLTFATCTGDLAVARRVVRGDRGLHPREYLQACATVARSPRLWLASAALSLARWAVVAAILLVAAHGLAAPWSIWAARALAFVALLLALWRIAVAVESAATAPRS